MNYGGTDPHERQEAAEQEAWARQHAYQPNGIPQYDGYWGSEPPQNDVVADWQYRGYHMEEAACDDAVPLDDSNDRELDAAGFDYSVPDTEDVDPLGNTGVDRSLVAERSRNVREHEGEFWERMRRPEGKANNQRGAIPPPPSTAGQAPVAVTDSGPVPAAQMHPGGRTVVWVMLIVLVLLVVGGMVTTEMFRITSITVTGNSIVSDKEIIELSGVKENGSMLMLKDEVIAENISKNRYLKLICMVHDNHHVTLQVYEREPVAYTSVRGTYYVMDIRGMLLEQYASDVNLKGRLLYVRNMNVHNCIVGRYIDLYDEEVMDAYLQLMLEFKAMSLMDTVSELFLEDLSNISLNTTSGFYVRLGDATELHRKLRAMVLTLEQLEEMGYAGGTVDVSVCETPTYRPDAVTEIAG